MPKNKTGGKAHRHAKNATAVKRELRFKEDMEDYCIVASKLGDCRFELRGSDGKKLMGKLCGSMKRKSRIEVGDLVLVSFREFQSSERNNCDIFYKYDADEIRNLEAYGEIKMDKKVEKEDVVFDVIDGPANVNVDEESSSSKEYDDDY